ncbi:MAG TPA: ATP-binding protein [Bryobacteraceae bacterium]|nr:ATP-binding protein [Bryobacteraceae bacterium]
MSVPCTPRSLTLAAKPESLRALTEFVCNGALEASLPEVRITELELILDELILNVCTHGYPDDLAGDVTVTYTIPAEGELSVEVADRGVRFDPLTAEPPNLSLSLEERPIGGLGIHLVKALARSLTYRRDDGYNRLAFRILAET